MKIKMKKRIGMILFTLLICLAMSFPVLAAGNLPRLVDDADLLTNSEESELLALLDEISERQKVDVVVVTVDSLDGYSPMEYADDFYDYNGYGFGADADGILLLISMEDRDWYISTCGYGITAFTDAGLDYIADAFLSDLSDGEYLDAFRTYAELCDAFISQANTGNPYDIDNMPKEPFPVMTALGISFGIGIVLALIITGIMAAQLKSVRKQAAAGEYIKKDSMKVTDSKDLFLYKHTERHARPKESSSGSHGGSSTHHSSSGRSHGGSGGKF